MSPLIVYLADFLGWIGNICFILGAIYLAKKKVSGFYYQIVANLMYLGQGMIFRVSSLWAISIILVFINIVAVCKWKGIKLKGIH